MKTKVRLKRLLPVIVVGVFVGLITLFSVFRPKSEFRLPEPPPALSVETIVLKPQKFDVHIKSYGMVSPRTKSSIAAQVSGKIIAVSPAFKKGALFNQGDKLLQIEKADLQADVDIAQAQLMDALQALETEKAEGEQALKNWRLSGNKGSASNLVLRKPQLQAAEAAVLAAQASLEKAKLNLARTEIYAPYDGRVLDTHVDVGQLVSSGTAIADIYSTTVMEVRLPIRNTDLPYLTLPEQYVDGEQVTQDLPEVTLSSGLNPNDQWNGHIVRTEGEVDAESRQLHVVAEIVAGDAHVPETRMRVGQYVIADIQGKLLDSAIVIPGDAIYQGRFAYVVENAKLQRKQIEIGWQGEDNVLIKSGLKENDELVLTPLGQVNSGTPVIVSASRY